MGFVAAKLHEALMANLIANRKEELAATLNDELKPAVDFLVHFDLEQSSWRPEADEFEGSDEDDRSSDEG